MKNVLKFTNLLLLTLVLLNYSCNKDDEVQMIQLQDLEVTIGENPTIGQVIGTIQGDGTTPSGFNITTQTPSGALQIDSGTGQLTVADATVFDFEINPVITAVISAENAGNTATVTINLTDIEVSLQDVIITIDENPANGQVIDTVQSNGGGNFDITSQTPAGALAINSNSGELTVADATVFDFETNPVITATVSDGEATNTATVTINLTNVNEITIQDLVTSFDENPSNGDVVGTVQTSGNGTLNLSITSQTPAGALQIDSSTGQLTVADATIFDYETNPVITMTISADDAISTATVTINLNNLSDPATVGEYRDGGVVFWVNPMDNTQGLVCAISDQGDLEWGCNTIDIPGANGTAIGTGAANTIAIEASCSTANTAADMASNLSLNGYNDWFIPSKDELNEMYVNQSIINATALANGGTTLNGTNPTYWSSSQSSSTVNIAWFQGFANGGQALLNKSGAINVRVVRAFQ